MNSNLIARLKRTASVALLLLLLTVCITWLISSMTAPEKVEIVEGIPLASDIYSAIDFTTLDHEVSDAAGKYAAAAVPRCCKLDTVKRDKMLAELDELAAELKERIADSNKNQIIDLGQGTPVEIRVNGLSPIAVEVFRRLNLSGHLDICFAAWKDLVRSGILAEPPALKLAPNEKILIFSDSGFSRNIAVPHADFIRLPAMLQKMTDETCRNLRFDEDPDHKIREEIYHLYQSVMTENLQNDEKMTEERRNAAVEAAKVYKKIHAGQLLLGQTDKLTAEDVRLYRDYRVALDAVQARESDLSGTLHQVALTLALLAFISLYIYHIHPEVASSDRAIWFLGGIALLSLLILRLIATSFFAFADAVSLPQRLVFLILPLALPSLLISVIYGYRSAIYIGLFVSGIAASAMNYSFAALLTGLLVSAVAGYTVRYIVDYKRFFIRAMIACFLATAFCSLIFASDYIFRSVPPSDSNILTVEQREQLRKAEQEHGAGNYFGVQVFVPDSGEFAPAFKYRIRTMCYGILVIPAISGMLTALLALLTLFLLESFFGVTSNMSYRAYTDRNHKLLKELQISAPGTYHHCERLAFLAEKAADAIGVDRIRVQACALFHDVGKLKFPGMFTENNAAGENPHSNFTPYKSAQLIKQHVTYGLELAKKYKLPPLIQRAIQTHHGTDFISFFYALAEKEKPEGAPMPAEKDFRYDGPLPTDREVMLIMLADCCEAAVQSIEEPTVEKVESMVNSLFEKKLKSGQLEESPLTIRELHTIRKAFVESLVSMHNKRIAYPDQDEKTARKDENA